MTQTYLPVDIQALKACTRDVPVDLFIKLSETNYAHVFSKSTGIEYKRLIQYIQKGVTQLHVRTEDMELFQKYLAQPAAGILVDPNVSNDKKVPVLINYTDQTLAEVFASVEIDPDSAEKAARIAKTYVEILSTNPNTLSVILKLVSHGDYLYYHSVAVCVFTLFLAKATGLFNRMTLEEIGMGAFLHDVGMISVPDSIQKMPRALTEEERIIVNTHPSEGLLMIDQESIVPDAAKFIIYQHHEQPSSKGYPCKLEDKAIYYPAKIVALADSFSALISKRPWRPAYKPEHAIKVIENEKDKFDPALVKILSGILGQKKST